MEPGFEIALHLFWEKNRNLILLAIAVALLAIVAREGFRYFAAQREKGVQAEYARVSDQPAKLAAFAEAHPSHVLAGIAWLQLADTKFSAGDFTAATASYQKAVSSLKNDALLGRAKLGAAISQVSGGNRAAGEAALKTLSADATLRKGVRVEATYHLAALAAESGNADEVRKLVEQASHIDMTSPWSQRATLLLASLPAGGKPAEDPASGLSFKPGK